jgi:hypothetical protein
MNTTQSPLTAETLSPKDVVEQFVELMARQDLAGVVSLYAPSAIWVVHVPGWDDQLVDPVEMLDLHQSFFGRDQFRIDRHEVIASGEAVALNWDLAWRDRSTGLPAASFQCHTFVVADGGIQLHRMYCAGVRVYDEPDTPDQSSNRKEDAVTTR